MTQVKLTRYQPEERTKIMWNPFKKKPTNPAPIIRRQSPVRLFVRSSGYTPPTYHNVYDPTDLANPMSPLSPFWVGHQIGETAPYEETRRHVAEPPAYENHSTHDSNPSRSYDPPSYDSSPGYDSGSSYSDSSSHSSDCGGGSGCD